MAPLKVLLCGAGVAGPAVAFWLNRLGCDTTIVERSDKPRNSGQQIDLRGQGVTAMRRMGIEAAVRRVVCSEPGVALINDQGTVQAYFGANKSGHGKQSFTSEFEIMRGDLCDILYDVTKEQSTYRFGVWVESYEQLEGTRGVRVRLTDGTEETYDLVVGADGLGSRTRRMMLGGAPDPHFSMGAACGFVTIPREPGDDDTMTMCLFPGRRVAATRMDRPDCLRVYFVISTADLPADHPVLTAIASRDVARQKEAFAEHYAGLGWKVPRFIRELDSPQADDWYAFDVAQVRLDSYSRGSVVLAGDAGYCPSPFTGLGTSLAMTGALVLAGEIARHCGLDHKTRQDDNSETAAERARRGIPAALKAYDETLRPYVTKAQVLPFSDYANVMCPKSAFTIRCYHWLLWLVAVLRLDQLFTALSSDDIQGWELPEYKELGRPDLGS
ncbi:FAD/NAD(P)-binding domain-containing protein [Xylariomycetidae sp. FL2044]|nr:FAD/NAD(P)-binding domain-containing protein [Xylariomycetidae sp. FL2044]